MSREAKKRGRKQSPKTNKQIQILLTELAGAIGRGEWGRYWTFRDIILIVNGQTQEQGVVYVNEKHKKCARYVLGWVKKILRERYSIAFYSVPQHGFRLWPLLSALPEDLKDRASEDAYRVFERWMQYVKNTLGDNGVLRSMKERGEMKLEQPDILLIEETIDGLKFLISEPKKYATAAV